MLSQYQGFLGLAYPVGQGGARHLRHLLDRRAVHRPALLHPPSGDDPGSAEDRAWIEREDKARTVILTPAMLVVWLLGLMLAVHLNILGQYWFTAKLASGLG